jgi:serine/threonine protein kinase
MIISNYELIKKIAEAPQTIVFKARHKKNPERLLVLKALKASNLSEYKKAQFKQKIEHLKVLNDPLVITPISFSDKDETSFITQDYFAGPASTNYWQHIPDSLCTIFSPSPRDSLPPSKKSMKRRSFTAASNLTISSKSATKIRNGCWLSKT